MKCNAKQMCQGQDSYQGRNDGDYSIKDSCCTFCGENLVEIYFAIDELDEEENIIN